jgi:O-antigen ligase
MQRNVGGLDVFLRIVLGIALLTVVFVGPTQTAWGWLGLVPLATAALQWCPLYTLLGIKTCRVSDAA